MKTLTKYSFFLLVSLFMTSCVTKKKLTDLQSLYDKSESDLVKCGDSVQDYKDRLDRMSKSQQDTENQRNISTSTIQERDMQISDLKVQILDYKNLRVI
jgi:chemotaxis protein MotB